MKTPAYRVEPPAARKTRRACQHRLGEAASNHVARNCAWRNARMFVAFTRQEVTEARYKDDRSRIMQALTYGTETDFWSDVYRERPIAILHRHGRLYVYLDHVLQEAVFDSGEDALAWLIQRVDQGVSARVH
jgi:hypothetical protein